MTRRSYRGATWLAFLALCFFMLIALQPAQADYFCKPYVRGDNAGTHIGTCRDIVVLPIDLRP